jgi:glyoxylase-like metal-dependent hydrolase (beta-lactamase superfamily II)
MLKIYTIYGAGYDSNSFILEESGEALLVDTGTGLHSARVQKMIEKFIPVSSVKQIILTHRHYDHVGGLPALLKATGAKVMMHELDAPYVEEAKERTAAFFKGAQERIALARRLKDADKISVGSAELEVLHTPGHTEGCICLYHAESKSLVSGDTVFAEGSVGRWDLEGGDYAALMASVKRLCLLDVENLYPGHGCIVEGGAGEHIQMALESL